MRRYRRYIYFTRLQLSALILGSVIAVSALGYGYVRYINSQDSGIVSKEIARKISFQYYFPDLESKEWNIPKNSVVYDDKTGVLSYTASSGNNNFYITAQSTPEVFKDVPQYYSSLLGKMNQYAVIKTSIGELNLTKPTELKGGQTAVINSQGTLMFIRPTNNISNDQWKNFINSLVVER